MPTTVRETKYASAERTSPEMVREQFEQLRENATLAMVLDAMPHHVVILDENRQIVAANASLVKAFSSAELDQILGARPGELIGCRHASRTAGGCGTTESCRNCGTVNAVLTAQGGVATTNACQVTLAESGESLDLSITASPVSINGRSLVLVSIQDMADENRRKVLERTFFHDVLNAAGGALGIANVLAESENMEEVLEFAPLLIFVTEQLISEIQSQRDMLAAERGDLAVQTEDFGTVQLLMEILNTYASHPVAEGRRLELAPMPPDHLINTSKTLLHRILGNMVKNALEATEPGGSIRIGCEYDNNEFCFWVNNPDVMPRATQLQIFNRSFSTKGPGRGIGTYSIRLLGERYLGGRVSFDSNEEHGTTFRIHLPKNMGTQ